MVYILIGSIGAGKTTIGKLLAEKLDYEYVELDQKALAKSGYKTVQEAIDKSPTKLKESELAAAKELSTQDNLVVAFGGSSVFNQLNFDYFKENKRDLKVVYLEVEVDIQAERILNKHNFTSHQANQLKNNLEKIQLERVFLYKMLSDFTIETTAKSPEELVKEILDN